MEGDEEKVENGFVPVVEPQTSQAKLGSVRHETVTVESPLWSEMASSNGADANKPNRRRRKLVGAAAKSYYVFDVPKGKKPVLVSRGALSLGSAKTFARVGATYGRADRVVTTNPKDKKSFTVLEKYKAGSGKKVRG